MLQRVNPLKAAGPGQEHKDCDEPLAEVFTRTVNLSLSGYGPQVLEVTYHLNDYHLVVFTPTTELVLFHIKAIIAASQDSYQFSYRANRSTAEAMSLARHTVLSHLERREDAIHRLQPCFQYCHPQYAHIQTPPARPQLFTMQLGPEFPVRVSEY